MSVILSYWFYAGRDIDRVIVAGMYWELQRWNEVKMETSVWEDLKVSFRLWWEA